MKSVIAHSIQDYLKKINTKISLYDLLGLTISFVFFGVLFLYLNYLDAKNTKEVVYIKGEQVVEDSKIHIFGSVSGSTYTFDWCSGASRTLERNRIYFRDEEAAKKSGRMLSKLCNK